MRKLYIYLLVAVAIAPLLTSCGVGSKLWTPYNYYIYQPHNVPTLRDAGEVAIDVALAHNYEVETATSPIPFPEINTSEIYGLTLNAAASPIKHLGIMGGYTHFHSDRVYSDASNGAPTITSRIGELGIGFYMPFAQYSIFECYLGNSLSLTKIVTRNGEVGKLNFNKTFVQTSIGFSYAPIDLVYTMRIGNSIYFNAQHSFSTFEGIYLERLAATSFLETFEHSLTFRLGYKHVKVQLQLGRGVCPRKIESSSTYIFLEKECAYTASLGLHLALGRKFP